MTRIQGWGILLAVCVPLLIFISWSRLGSEKGRINLDRFETYTQGSASGLMAPLAEHYLRTQRLALPADALLPAVPGDSGIASWAVQADTTVLLNLDARADGRTVQLRFVPIVSGATGILYDCVSSASQLVVGKFCRADSLRSMDDIPAQLAANEQAIKALPAVMSAAGVALAPGTQVGRVLLAPANLADLDNCGTQCVKPQSCVNARPLACVISVTEKTESGTSGTQLIVPTPTNFRGTDLATRSAADAACVQAFGAGYTVATAYSLWGSFKLTGGSDYWVHESNSPQSNCWRTDYN